MDGEHHFETVGKRKVRKWFRIPDSLCRDLLAIRSENSPYVFAACNDQLRKVHADNPSWLQHVSTFTPDRFGDWVYKRVRDWSMKQGKKAHVHIIRKTAMQYARRGEDINQQVANDLRVSTPVMLRHYVNEGDKELRASSNASFHRLIAAFPAEVAFRYGHVEAESSNLERKLQIAVDNKEWELVQQLTTRLANQNRSEAS